MFAPNVRENFHRACRLYAPEDCGTSQGKGKASAGALMRTGFVLRRRVDEGVRPYASRLGFAVDCPIFHHEVDFFHHRYIGQRVAGYGNYVSQLAGFDGAEEILHA
jgi:hypothetical protein